MPSTPGKPATREDRIEPVAALLHVILQQTGPEGRQLMINVTNAAFEAIAENGAISD